MSADNSKSRSPKIFIGSSKEGLELARIIQDELGQDAIAKTWKQSFSLSKVTIHELLENLDKSDFGIFVLTPDDPLLLRGNEVKTARDNVILEMGMYVGKLGLERTFFVIPEGDYNFHLPTDLSGVVWAGYKPELLNEEPQIAVATACNQIRRQIKILGQKPMNTPIPPTYLDSNNVISRISDEPQALARIVPELLDLGIGRKAKHVSIRKLGEKLDIEVGTVNDCIEAAIKKADLKMDKRFDDTVVIRRPW